MATWCILVAEDHEPLLQAIRRILEAEGWTVLTATDGEEVLRLMEENRPDMILTDIMMPRMDGYALREAVRARPDWAAIPFIFLTAWAEQEDNQRGGQMGVTAYVVKPFEPHDLIDLVRTYLPED